MADKPVKVREDIDSNIDVNSDEVSVAPIEERRPPRKSAPPRYAGPQQQRSGNRSNYDNEGGRGVVTSTDVAAIFRAAGEFAPSKSKR